MSGDGVRYRFGPLERRGVLLGWRGGQIVAVVVGLVVALASLRGARGPVGAVVALAAVSVALVVAWWPIGGRTVEQWFPTVARWTWRVVGTGRGPGGGPAAPVRGVSILDAAAGGRSRDRTAVGSVLGTGPGAGGAGPGAGGAGAHGAGSGPRVGVVHDARARTLTAALALSAQGFALLGAAEKDRRVARWSAVLAALSREGSVVHRVQWSAMATPDDGRRLWSYFGRGAVLDGSAPARRSYADLLGTVTASLVRHRVVLCVQVRLAGRAARQVRLAGGGLDGGCAVLVRELGIVERALRDADILVEGALDPDALARTIRDAWTTRPADGAGSPWPGSVSARWATLRTGGTWHATYWVSEWPRSDVGPEFLTPLLVADERRTVSMVMEPVDPSRALKAVQRARTADVADSELRRRGGFLGSARRSRESEVVVRRESELADGHGSYRFTGYLTVTAASAAALEASCESAEQAAAQSGLELRRLYGEQDRGLLCVWPLCVGVR